MIKIDLKYYSKRAFWDFLVEYNLYEKFLAFIADEDAIRHYHKKVEEDGYVLKKTPEMSYDRIPNWDKNKIYDF